VASLLNYKKPILLTETICEPDLDMARVTAGLSGGKLRRLIGSVFRNSRGRHNIDNPQRSVDREQQWYSANYDYL
jgi:hypothetical protein